MNKDQATQWVLKEMEKLTPKHRIKTFFTLAELRPDDPYSDQVRYVVLPVDVYECDTLGYEIMPINILAKNCPWDMTNTLVKIKTENTDILDNLHNLVIEDAELHQHLSALEGR